MMNRIEELTSEIQEYLKDNDMNETYITTPTVRDDNEIWLTNLMNVTNAVSIVTIEPVEDPSDRWGQISVYKRVKDSNVGYTIILNSSAERLGIESIKDLAEVIYDYETLEKKLTLTIK